MKNKVALARWPSWLEGFPVCSKAAGPIPSWGAHMRHQVDVSLSRWYFSLSLNKYIHG